MLFRHVVLPSLPFSRYAKIATVCSQWAGNDLIDATLSVPSCRSSC